MIRQAKFNDLNTLMDIVHDAVSLLKGMNVNQWQNGYPNTEVFTDDINKGTLWVVELDGRLAGFCNLSMEDDISYQKIYEGNWLTKDKPYLVVHRLAVKKDFYKQGIAKMMFGFAEVLALKNNIKSIRVDTHRDNIPMNKILQQLGYVKCGVIYLVNFRDEDKARVAYEKLL